VQQTTRPTTKSALPAVSWQVIERLEQHQEYGTLNGTELRVLLHLLRRARVEDAAAYPAARSIAIAIGNARSSVQLALARLNKLGLIRRAGTRRSKFSGGRGVVRWIVELPPPPPRYSHEAIKTLAPVEASAFVGYPRSLQLSLDAERRRMNRRSKAR
jgi:hypothetical protein